MRNPDIQSILLGAALILYVHSLSAQTTIFGANLIVNGDAESGPGGDGTSRVTSIPGWTATGAADVYAYGSASANVNALSPNDIVPVSHGNNYFAGGAQPANSSLTQSSAIDLSSAASTIDAGTVTFAASAYLGGFGGDDDNATVTIAFLDGNGALLKSIAVGAVKAIDRAAQENGLYLRRQIGQVPAQTRKATVTLNFNWVNGKINEAYADNLSLILNAPASPQSLMGINLIANPGGDASPGYTSDLNIATARDLPGWVRSAYFTSDSYTDPSGDLTTATVGPQNPGINYFYGGNNVMDDSNPVETAYQDIDVSSAASLIDTGAITYALSGWLGGYSTQDDNCVLTAEFRDWNGSALGKAVLGPVLSSDRQGVTELLQRTANGNLPAGTRTIHFLISMSRTDGTNNDGLADSLSLTLSNPGNTAPAIAAKGVISAGAFGAFTSIAPGSWIEIYGSNLSSSTRSWAGSDFTGVNAPTSLDGVKVTIGGQPAFIDYISGGQIDAQVPSGVGTGPMPLIVSNSQGTSAPYTITVNTTEPGLLSPASFNIGGKQYAAALFPDGATFVLPSNAISGVASRPAKPGDTIILYGVGFGAVDPNIPAGQIARQSNNLAAPLTISFGGVQATVSYQGLAPNFVGLYQFNVVVPQISDSDSVPLTFNLGGVNGTQALVTSIHQ